MPYDDGVGAHGLQGERGVLQRLALGDGGALGGEVDDVGRQPLGGGLEGDPGAGGVLEEEVDDGSAAQRRQLLDRPVGEPGHLLGGVEDEDGVVAGEVGGRDEVALHLLPGAFRGMGCEVVARGRGHAGARAQADAARAVGAFGGSPRTVRVRGAIRRGPCRAGRARTRRSQGSRGCRAARRRGRPPRSAGP